jgi:hypothetical protein
MNPKSYLFYGAYGSGKTTLATSAFWDFKKEELVKGRVGRVVYVGREMNEDLGIPEEYVRRFPYNERKPLKFADNLIKWLEQMNMASKKNEEGITDFVFDGITEFCENYLDAIEEEESEEVRKNSYHVWRRWKSMFKRWVQLTHPVSLGMNVFVTARVKEKRDSDEEWRGDQYYPDVMGWARNHLGNYFNHIVYMKQGGKTTMEGGKPGSKPERTSFWIPGGEYAVKNTAEHKWLEKGVKGQLVNVTWPEVEEIFRGLE